MIKIMNQLLQTILHLISLLVSRRLLSSHKLFHVNWMDRDAINMSVCIRFKLVLEIGGSLVARW